MSALDITYRAKTAPEEEIYSCIAECSDNFSSPLGSRVNLKDYSSKIARDTITFEAWAGTKLVGLIAAYFNDPKNHAGYITNVCTAPDFLGKGIASTLMDMCIQYAQKNDFNEIKLEVFKSSNSAINLYKKYHFEIVGDKGNIIDMTLNIDNS
jgi:ribosomal protein S18 acetylase RimI-like enzyme